MSMMWRKVWRDLWGNKVRTILVMLSIAVGVFAVGYVSSSFVMILNDMDADYQSVNPHGAIIYCEPFDDTLVQAVRRIPGVGQAEGRSGLSARAIVSPDEKVPMGIVAVPPVEEIVIDHRFRFLAGWISGVAGRGAGAVGSGQLSAGAQRRPPDHPRGAGLRVKTGALLSLVRLEA
jgi:putative ABC transport system permease protein